MKKLLAILMACLLVLSMAATVMADDRPAVTEIGAVEGPNNDGYSHICISFDKKLVDGGDVTNVQASSEKALADSVKSFIKVNGKTVGEIIKAANDDAYASMVHFIAGQNGAADRIDIWDNPNASVKLIAGEENTVELLEGLKTPNGAAVAPSSWEYDPGTKKWTKVEAAKEEPKAEEKKEDTAAAAQDTTAAETTEAAAQENPKTADAGVFSAIAMMAVSGVGFAAARKIRK